MSLFSMDGVDSIMQMVDYVTSCWILGKLQKDNHVHKSRVITAHADGLVNAHFT